jgi:hypothetical protein
MNASRRWTTSIVLALCGLALALAPRLSAQTASEPAVATFSPKQAQRGQTVFVTVRNPPKNARTATLWFGDTNLENQALADGTITVNVPNSLALGTYSVRVGVGGYIYPAADKIDIVRTIGTKATLAKIDPAVIYGPDDRIELVLMGADFVAGNSGENTILFNGDAQKVAWDGCGPADRATWKDAEKDEIHGGAEPGQIQLCNVSVAKQANILVAVKQGPEVTAAKRLSTYRWTQWEIILASLAVVGLAALLVVGLMCFKPSYRIQQKDYGFFRALFLDPETDTYSLSKYQFYMWTAAALFTYSYLVICRMFIQDAGLPDVPSNLPAIVGIGAGTSIGAQVITNVKGPKGAGEELPSLSDFLTSGGVAAPERVQMFLWTTFGVLAFAIAAAKVLPANVTGVPQVPEALMYLMGLSSAGYLGGKLARKPGPVINEIAVTPSQPDDVAGMVITRATVELDQPVAAARQVLATLTVSLANLPASSPPAAAKAANDAVAALRNAVRAAQGFTKSGDVTAAVDQTGQAAEAADVAARQAAQEFDRLSVAAPPDRGIGTARDAAQIAQAAAFAAQRLATSGATQISAGLNAQRKAVMDASAGPAERVIELRGRNLSIDATFEIADDEMPFRMLLNSVGEHAPEMVAKEEDQSVPNMGRVIRLRIALSELDDVDHARYQKWFGTKRSDLNLTIVNPDGQKSVISFRLPPGAEQARTPAPAPPAPSQAAGG